MREGASHERVRYPRNRDQQGAPQRRPRDAAARPRERSRTHEGGRDDNVLQRVRDEREAGEDLVGADQGRVNNRGHRDHHERAQVRGPPPRPDAASAREEGRDDRNHDVGQLGEVGQAIDEALGGARPAVGGTREQALLYVRRRSVAIKGRNDEGGGDARPGEGGNHPVDGAPATAQFSHVNHRISTLTETAAIETGPSGNPYELRSQRRSLAHPDRSTANPAEYDIHGTPRSPRSRDDPSAGEATLRP